MQDLLCTNESPGLSPQIEIRPSPPILQLSSITRAQASVDRTASIRHRSTMNYRVLPLRLPASISSQEHVLAMLNARSTY